MIPEVHVQFTDGVKSFKAYEAVVSKAAKEMEHLKAFVIQMENDAASLERQVVAKKAEIEALEAQIREKRLMGDANLRSVQERLDKRHMELVERESKVRFMEQAAQEQLNKANGKLADAESGKRKILAAK